MAIEDCVADVNFPRVDDYGPYLYLAVHSARWGDDEIGPTIKELDILLGKNYIVTYHEEPTRGVTRAREMVGRRGAILAKGPDHLLYLILDVMVDNYMLNPVLSFVEDLVSTVIAAIALIAPFLALIFIVAIVIYAARRLHRAFGPPPPDPRVEGPG